MTFGGGMSFLHDSREEGNCSFYVVTSKFSERIKGELQRRMANLVQLID